MSYAELHCKSNFSFLEGASHPEELVARAAELGYQALAITDRASLAGVVRAHAAAKEHGLKLLIGAEIHVAVPLRDTKAEVPRHSGTPLAEREGYLVLLAMDRAGYGRLSRLITLGRRQAPKGECYLTAADMAAHSEGLIACLLSGEAPGRVVPRKTQPPDADEPTLAAYREMFGDRTYLLAELHRGPDDAARLDELVALARRLDVPLAAAGDVHYHVSRRLTLHQVLTAVRHHRTVAECGEHLFPNADRRLQPLEEIAARFARAPQAVERTGEIAARCHFSLDELRYDYPIELAPPGESPSEYLERLAWAGASERYPQGVPDKVQSRLRHELALIRELRYEAYFLTVWDLVVFARGRGILCQGRGSAANSAVCYCLGVTSVDPDRMDLLFERFISRERNEAPDIDIDFEHERREEVLQYVYEKYGRERAGMTAEVITYCARSAIRDVGKALGFSLDRVDALAKQVEGYRSEPKLAEHCQAVGIDTTECGMRNAECGMRNSAFPTPQPLAPNPSSTMGRQLVELVHELIGFPRHLSQHVGGMVITHSPLCELVPIENAAMPGRTVIQWNKDDLDELGILKVDCLALGMLTAIRKCLEELGARGWGLGNSECGIRNAECGVLKSAIRTPQSALALIPPEDPRVYDMICQADTMGVFQIESRAQMSMLPRLRPRCFYDLVIEVAIVRPGPIQGEMVHPYLRRRNGEEPVTFPNEAVREVLAKTLGVPLFQEQAMRLAIVAAGFTPGEADQLRRAMGAWRRPGVIDRFREKLLTGMLERGLSQEFAERAYHQIRGFGEYGFPESHAASFALLVYVSAWLKCYHPAAYTAALLNSQPMGFYAPAQLVRNAREHGVTVLPVDVNHSAWDCTLEEGDGNCGLRIADCGMGFKIPHSAFRIPHSLRLGFRLIRGLPRAAAEAIVAARDRPAWSGHSVPRIQRPYTSLADVAERTGLSRAILQRLAEADVFSSLWQDRRLALWHALDQETRPAQRPLLRDLDEDDHGTDDSPLLPPLAEQEQVVADYQTAGLSLRAHPMSFARARLARLGIISAAQLAEVEHNRPVRVAGLVLLRQRPSTAKGITFVTLEDETGTANLVIHQRTWERNYQVARTSTALVAHGHVERKDQVIHVVVRGLEDLTAALHGLTTRSRDFR